MFYLEIKKAIFQKRVNRFLGIVVLNGEKVEVHIPNTSRLTEILIPGKICYIEPAKNKNRKTKYTLISIFKDHRLFSLDSQIPHKLLLEELRNKNLEEFNHFEDIKSEITFGDSRFDLSFTNSKTGKKGFIEVKGVTLEENGMARFPGAPTTRGTKHLLDLIKAVSEGYEAMVFFLLQFEGACEFTPYLEMDPLFSKTLKKAKDFGVRVIAYDSRVTKDSISIHKKVPVLFYE